MKGLDISFSMPSQQWWEDRRAEGFEAMVQNLWTGGFASNDGIKAVAATNLRRARLADYKVAAYVNASPPDWWSIQIQMDNIRTNAGAEWNNLKEMAVDMEIPRTTKARVFELADALRIEGKNVDVLYTAHWFWTGHMGNSKDIAWRRFKLWNADYDGDPTIDFPRPYGPWTKAEHKQYAGTTYINERDGRRQAIDLNTFNDSWLVEAAPPLKPPVEEDDMLSDTEKKLLFDTLADLKKRAEREEDIYVRVEGSRAVYRLDEVNQRLIHVISGPIYRAETAVVARDYPSDHAIWKLSTTYPGGVPTCMKKG